jgi:hypothetical protein
MKAFISACNNRTRNIGAFVQNDGAKWSKRDKIADSVSGFVAEMG